MTKTIDGAIVDWLEELPLDEFVDETARMIVEQFRNGSLPVNEAMDLLAEDCGTAMHDWIEQNKAYAKMFK